jgi:hypothetical protein
MMEPHPCKDQDRLDLLGLRDETPITRFLRQQNAGFASLSRAALQQQQPERITIQAIG